MTRLPSPEEDLPVRYAVGIDVGSQSCSFCVLLPDKSIAIKPTDFANAAGGFALLQEKLQSLEASPGQILVGLEATSRYGENLYGFLERHGYRLALLHPAQTHQFAKRRGLRAKTDKLDASTLAHVLLSAEARAGYVPSDLIVTYRELVRLHTTLSDEATRYRNEIHALLVVLFPEFTQVFADPCRKTALALLQHYPSAHAFAEAGVESVTQHLHDLAPHRYGRPTAEQLVALAPQSVSSGWATPARAMSLRVLCDQLAHTRVNLATLEREIDALLAHDPGAQGLQAVQEFGATTIAVLRAELGDVERFARCDQVVAYAGLDITIKESGKWRGQRKLSKRGSGRLRRILYMAAVRSIRLDGSAFGAYFQRLVARGMKRCGALVAVMRKMLAVVYHLLKTHEPFDPAKVGLGRAA